VATSTAPDADTEAYSLIGLECLDWACGEAMPTGTGAAATDPVLRHSMGRGGIPIAADPVSDYDILARCGYDHTFVHACLGRRNGPSAKINRRIRGGCCSATPDPFVLGRASLFSA